MACRISLDAGAFPSHAEKNMAGRNGIIVALGVLSGLAGCSHQQASVPQG